MKNIANLVIMLCVVRVFTACSDYLDVDHLLNDSLDLQGVFESKDYSEQWLAGVYSHLRNWDNWDVCSKENGGSTSYNQFNFISDDMLYTDREKATDLIIDGKNVAYTYFRGGQYNENIMQESWKECYIGIRDASIFIHNIDINKQMTPQEIKITKAEARFLRAYYYWLLLRKYGPIPILPDEGVDFTKSYDELAIPRSRYDVCADYIADELALAARDLPSRAERSNREIAKATRGAALAARAKVLLYSASPQYNGNQSAWARQLLNYDGTPLIDPEYKEERWAKAAAAAKEVMDLGEYYLYTVPKRDSNGPNMKGAEGVSQYLGCDYFYPAQTIEPGKSIAVVSGKTVVETRTYPGYSDKPFGNGGNDCGWADIDPCESYRQVFNGELTAYSNPELIFTRGYDNTMMNRLAEHQFPQTLGGWNCHGLTMKMYDAYYMADGSDFYRCEKRVDDAGKIYFYSNPTAAVPDYAKNYTLDNSRSDYHYKSWAPLPTDVSLQNGNREPRFYASVAYNGCVWENATENVDSKLRYSQTFYYLINPKTLSVADGMNNANGFYIWTGIGIKKYINPRDNSENNNQSGLVQKAEPAIRYAEVLLIYAEALNEMTSGQSYSIPDYKGEGTVTVRRTKEEVSKGLRPVRVRAGLTDFTDDYFDDPKEMQARIKREWQIEFMGEAHRYYDLRRWGDAEREESQVVYGYNMTMSGATTPEKDSWHTPVPVTKVPAIFSEKMYLWPISHDELRKNRKLTQNPGWTMFDE
ncbi:MAG: RagB/SusD family nutrient uptake outer membrane protein [Prevotella sp.]|nr:RagB/SusD family nutrient uptake outer membrane protein [Prevotella sp.]